MLEWHALVLAQLKGVTPTAKCILWKPFECMPAEMTFCMTCPSKESNIMQHLSVLRQRDIAGDENKRLIQLEALPANSSTAYPNACLRLGSHQWPETGCFPIPVCHFSEDTFWPNVAEVLKSQGLRSLNLQHCQLTAVMAHHNLRDCQLETREFTSWAARPSHVQPFLAASPTQGVQMQTCYCLPKGLCCETAEKSFCSLAWISIPAQLLPPKLTRYMSSSLPFTIHSR